MKLTVVGSSSHGNGYILESSFDILFIEAGIRFKTMYNAISDKSKRIVGTIISHEHGDHAKYVADHLAHGVKVFALPETIRSLKIESPLLYPFQSDIHVNYKIGEFLIHLVPMLHDVPCTGFVMQHPEMDGRLLFVTDTMNCKSFYRGVKHLLIEANYEDTILRENVHNGLITKDRAERLRHTHMNFATTKWYVKKMIENGIHPNEIVLLHLSDQNSDAETFSKDMRSEFGTPTFIADKGLTLAL